MLACFSEVSVCHSSDFAHQICCKKGNISCHKINKIILARKYDSRFRLKARHFGRRNINKGILVKFHCICAKSAIFLLPVANLMPTHPVSYKGGGDFGDRSINNVFCQI